MIKYQRFIKPIISLKGQNWLLFLSLFASLYVVYYALTYLPIIDFRAYAEGKNIREGMEYKEDGEIPPVHDFYLESETDDLTETILDAPKTILIVVNNLEHTPKEAWANMKALYKNASEKGYSVHAVSSSSSVLVKQAIANHQLAFDILFCDSTTLKTMCRANPGVLVLNKATVVQKFSWRHTNHFLTE